MWVVKFGGSLFDAANLKQWLGLFAKHSSVVLVPGGGPFADQVRAAQAQIGFDDITAHAMALLAMEQYGRMLCGLQPGLTPAADAEAIATALEKGDTPVWMPLSMVLSDPSIEQNWQITSDSLAVWLAEKLGIDKLAVVKSVRIERNRLTSEWLVANEIVDCQFTNYLRRSTPQTWILGPTEHKNLDKLLQGEMAEVSARSVSV
ncbi:MAG: hypothetical protein P8163_03340 [Candidatus Thiodiazotropha sp.]